MFSTIPVAGSGLVVDQTWLDTIGGNIANANDAVTPGGRVYREEYVQVMPETPAAGEVASGVQVVGIPLGSARGKLAWAPGNPLANAQGMVEYPNIHLGHEMVSLVNAERSFQANAAVLSHSVNAYKSILAITE